MTHPKLSSMTPEEGRRLSIRNARVERIFCEESALVPIRQYTRAMKEFSEAEHAAFLRGFEAAREASAKIAADFEYRLAFGSAETIRALTPADARASSNPGAASETDLAKGQSSEGAQPPGSSSAGSRDSAPSADASAPGSECPVAARSAGESFDPTTESAHEMRDADRGGSDAAAGY